MNSSVGDLLQMAFHWEATNECHNYWSTYNEKWRNIPCSENLHPLLWKTYPTSEDRVLLFRELARVFVINPKAVHQWATYHERFGNLPSSALLETLSDV